MESVIRENFHLCNSESGKFCLWDPQSRALKLVIKLKEFEIPLTIAIRNPIPGVRNPCRAFQNARLSWSAYHLYGNFGEKFPSPAPRIGTGLSCIIYKIPVNFSLSLDMKPGTNNPNKWYRKFGRFGKNGEKVIPRKVRFFREISTGMTCSI